MRPRLGVGGGLKYVHVACTPVLTLSHVGGRSKADIDAGQVLPGFTGALVRDGYAAYRHLAMRQSEEGLTAGIEATPPGSPLLTVGANALGEVVRGPAGQRNRGGVAQHGEAPVWVFHSWSAAVLPGASHPSILGSAGTATSCEIILERGSMWRCRDRFFMWVVVVALTVSDRAG